MFSSKLHEFSTDLQTESSELLLTASNDCATNVAEAVKVCENKRLPALSLTSFPLFFWCKHRMIWSGVQTAVRNMLVRIFTAVCQAPAAKFTRASRALKDKTAVAVVQESFMASGATQGQNLFADMPEGCFDLQISIVHTCQTDHFQPFPLLHLFDQGSFHDNFVCIQVHL